MNEYRIIRDAEGKNWEVAHVDRGKVGTIWRMGQEFRATVDDDGPIGYGRSLKSLAEQLIWYDRAMNLEAA